MGQMARMAHMILETSSRLAASAKLLEQAQVMM